LAAGGLALPARHAGLSGPFFWLLAAAALIAGSAAGVALTNVVALKLVRPRMLPRLDFSRGIPAEHRTLVVVPSLLAGPPEVAKLLEDLEIRYLGNRDRNLYFGLLTDFPDADEQELPGDGELVGLARAGIQALNEKYAAADGRPQVFFFFHRKRVWNPASGSGWDTNASAASWSSSMPCCGTVPWSRSMRSSGTCRSCRPSST
jgi:hypothetical protein